MLLYGSVQDTQEGSHEKRFLTPGLTIPWENLGYCCSNHKLTSGFGHMAWPRRRVDFSEAGYFHLSLCLAGSQAATSIWHLSHGTPSLPHQPLRQEISARALLPLTRGQICLSPTGLFNQHAQFINIPHLKWMDQNTCSFAVQLLSCVWLCNPMDLSTLGFPVHHQLPEFMQTHIHQIGNAIQPSHPLSSPSPPAFNLSQHQGLLQWVSSSYQVAKVLEFQPQHQSFQWISRPDFL